MSNNEFTNRFYLEKQVSKMTYFNHTSLVNFSDNNTLAFSQRWFRYYSPDLSSHTKVLYIQSLRLPPNMYLLECKKYELSKFVNGQYLKYLDGMSLGLDHVCFD